MNHSAPSDSEQTPSPDPEASAPAAEAPEASASGLGPDLADESPPPVEGGHDLEPAVLALVFLAPPLALGGSAIGLLLYGGFAWNALGIGLVIGLAASIGFFFVVRRVFASA